MSRPEILAPAGNREMLGAAVFSGADAVYLGLTGFNARRTAGNFTPDELREAVAFCHARGVKVHVTLNTLVYDRELSGLADACAPWLQPGRMPSLRTTWRRRSWSKVLRRRCICTARPR